MYNTRGMKIKSRSRRNSQGQFRRSYREALAPLFWLCLGVILLAILQWYFAPQELKSPCPDSGCVFEISARAMELPQNDEVIEVVQDFTVLETKADIEAYIRFKFKDNGDQMVKIFTCESGLNPNNVGDTHIMGMLDGEMVGDSIGIAQIRTGDAGVYDSQPWNRAKANGMTVVEFREKLMDAKFNIDYSYEIYQRQGVNAWYNCYQKVK